MSRALDAVAFRLLAAVTPPEHRDALLGDLLEEQAERGGLARESLLAVPPMLALRVRAAGGLRALGFACMAGVLAASACGLAVSTLWRWVLFLVPLRAGGDLPLAWWLAGLGPALVAGVLAGRIAMRLAVRLLGGRA